MIYYLTLAVVLVAGVVSTPKALGAYRVHRHDAVMGRIAELEVSTGMGLVYAKEWADARPAAKTPRLNTIQIAEAWRFVGALAPAQSNPVPVLPQDRMNAPVHADDQPNRNDAMSGQS